MGSSNWKEGDQVVVQAIALDKPLGLEGCLGKFVRYSVPHGFAVVGFMTRNVPQDARSGLAMEKGAPSVFVVLHPESLRLPFIERLMPGQEPETLEEAAARR